MLPFLCASSRAQDRLDWSEADLLQLSNFASKDTKISADLRAFNLMNAVYVDFSYATSRAEFMLTKNFNSKVSCYFSRPQSFIHAPDSAFAADLLAFARYQFDLHELSARKLRQRIYEEKGAFSRLDFFQPIYNEIQQEIGLRASQVAAQTQYGREHVQLALLHQELRAELAALSDFCKECKPSRKKKDRTIDD